MVKVSAADVKKLREATGAGMMDCKKALVEAENKFYRRRCSNKN
jgi:elongation factor Ts